MEVQGIAFDTMVAAYVLNSSDRRYNLGELAVKYLGEQMVPYSEMVKDENGKAQPLAQVSLDTVTTYACHDADVTWRLQEVLEKKLKEQDLYEFYTSIELPLTTVLQRMEYQGVLVDVDFLKKLGARVAKDIAALETEIYDIAGEKFNINSPKQLQVILFEKIGLTPVKKTKTGYSTNVQVLEQLSSEHDLPAKILEYRHLAKLANTYITALPTMVNKETGRIHTTYNQTGAATGRLSSTDPNLQNIPIRTELGREIRKAFIAPPGHVLLAADYSQFELRLLAHFSDDVALVEAFHAGGDIHAATAALMFGKDKEDVTKDERRAAKTINFGIMYGMSAFRLSNELGISRKDAQDFIDTYFETYEGVKHFIDRCLEEARENLFVTTMYGRKRYLPELDNRNRVIREAAEREAVNTPIQGTQADIIKIAMINIEEELREKNLKTKMVLQVHDELVFEVPEEELELVEKIVQNKMENVVELRVPIVVEWSTGKNWYEAH